MCTDTCTCSAIDMSAGNYQYTRRCGEGVGGGGGVGYSNIHYMPIPTKLCVNLHITRNRTPQNRCIYWALRITCTQFQNYGLNQLVISRSIYFKMTLTGFSTLLQVPVPVQVWFLNLSKKYKNKNMKFPIAHRYMCIFDRVMRSSITRVVLLHGNRSSHSHFAFRGSCGIWLYQFLIIAYLFTFHIFECYCM